MYVYLFQIYSDVWLEVFKRRPHHTRKTTLRISNSTKIRASFDFKICKSPLNLVKVSSQQIVLFIHITVANSYNSDSCH